MKKILIIIAFAAYSLFTSCSIFVSTPAAKAGAKVGSVQPVQDDNATKAARN